MRDDGHGVAIDLGQEVASEHIRRRANLDQPAGRHHGHPVSMASGQVEVVENGRDRRTFLGQGSQHRHHQLLVTHVEKGRRLIEQQHRGLLRQHPGKRHPGPLPTRQRREKPPL